MFSFSSPYSGERLVAPLPFRRQSLRRHNYDVPHLCAGQLYGIRSSLPLRWGAGDIEYMERSARLSSGFELGFGFGLLICSKSHISNDSFVIGAGGR